MDLFNKAMDSNDFGLRQSYPWTCQNPKYPWVVHRISRREKSYVYSILRDVFYWHEMTVKRIENPFLWGQYALRYEEMRSQHVSNYVDEEVVVHATSIDNAYKIADTNFNWRLVNRCRFGQGISFAMDADYADAQATESDAYIISGILVANSEIGNYGTKIPSDYSDTTTNRQESVYVKYNDNEYYPYYMVY